MTKQHFIALADDIREHNRLSANNSDYKPFTLDQLHALALFCCHANPRFNRDRWLGYIAGENGQNGGKVKP